MLQAIKPLQQQSSVINMCDYFWQRMEKSLQGDLTDIFRGSGLADPPTDVPTAITDSWQLLPDPPAAFPVSADGFLNIKDPLLHELVGTGFFGSPAKAVPSNSFSSMQLEVSPLIRTKASVKVGGAVQIPSPRTPTIKRRKNQARKVVCIPAPAVASSRPGGEVVPSDLWAWRKYGQKPIKGSPYPRGYYRCSSSKGCLAKKQVERSRTDPNMLVITYTSDHNHPWPTQRNALAGSTRSQPSKSNNASASKSSSLSQKLLPENIISEEFEAKETMSSCIQLVEEAQEMAQHDDFDQVFHENLNELEPDDFFAHLAELDADPMSLVLPNIFI